MASQSSTKDLSLPRLKLACSACSLHELCLPAGLDAEELQQIDRLVKIGRAHV